MTGTGQPPVGMTLAGMIPVGTILSDRALAGGEAPRPRS